jgi:hypothetical protein
MQREPGGSRRRSLAWPIFVCLALSACGEKKHHDDEPVDSGMPLDMPDSTVVDSGEGGDGDEVPDAGHDAGMPDAGGGDPCNGISASGHCLDEKTIEHCVVPTGAAPRHLSTFECATGTRCDDTGVRPECVLDGACIEDTKRCKDTNTLETCSGGAYVPEACAKDCVPSALGAFCAGDVETVSFTGAFSYDAKVPNDDLTDWSSSTTKFPGGGFLVLSYQGATNDTLLDAVVTSESDGAVGQFDVRVPKTPGEGDHIVVVAAGADVTQNIGYVIADPGFGADNQAHSVGDYDSDNARVWSWSYDLNTLTSGDELELSPEYGSAAAREFDVLRHVVRFTEHYYSPKDTASLIIWLGFGNEWDCGACMASAPVDVLNGTFSRQLWLDGSDNESYWSDAVTAHELGHYIMSAHSFEPSEGGPHYLGYPTNPGQAWSEGWATFFSSLERDNSIYYDKQMHAFFWADIDKRKYDDAMLVWHQPDPNKGLDQLIEENEVSAMLYGAYGLLGDPAPLFTALSSARMTQSPFARGYTTRQWSDPMKPQNYTDTGVPQPYLPDFFDALRCENAITAEQLDTVTEPSQHYPYDSENPLCN